MSLNPQSIGNSQEQYEFFEIEHLARREKDATTTGQKTESSFLASPSLWKMPAPSAINGS